MAKLAKSRFSHVNVRSFPQVEPWDPPVVSAPASQKLMPPPVRPAKSPSGPVTPSQSSPQTSQQGLASSSTKKKRRRKRSSRKNGTDSFSETGTTLSEDISVIQDSQPTAKPQNSEPTPSQRSRTILEPTLSAEEKVVFNKEPESFGVYDTSSGEDSDVEVQSLKGTKSEKRGRLQTYSPTVLGVVEDSTQAPHHNLNGHNEDIERPQLSSDTANGAQQESAQAPQKLSDGRYACPLKNEYNCNKDFGSQRSAIRHAESHVNPDKFKCTVCGKGFSRNDLLSKHSRSHVEDVAHHAQHVSEPESESHPTATRKVQSPDVDAVSAELADKAASDVADVDPNRVIDSHLTSDAPALVVEYTGEVTSAEEETETEDEVDDAEDEEQKDNSVADSFERRTPPNAESELAVDDVSGDETTSSSEEDEGVQPSQSHTSVVPEASAPVNGVKRKRRSAAQNSESAASTPRKRLRKDSSQSRSELEDQTAQEADVSDVQSAGALEAGSSDDEVDVHSETENRDEDIEMQEVDPQSSSQSAKKSTPTENEAIYRLKQRRTLNGTLDVGTGSTIATDDESEDSDEGKESHASQGSNSSQKNSGEDENVPAKKRRKVTSDSANATLRRQSSMDDFVRRSEASTSSAAGPSRSKEIIVHVPPRTKANVKEQQLLAPKQKLSRSKLNRDEPETIKSGRKAFTSAEHESTQSNAKKGKSKASKSDGENSAPIPVRSKAVKKSNQATTKTAKVNGKPKKQKHVKSKEKGPTSESESEQEESRNRGRPVSASGSWAVVSKTGLTGRFTEEEVQVLLSYRDSFCDEHDISHSEFNDLMTASTKRASNQWTFSYITKGEFLQQYYDQLPSRNRRSMLRFRERHFQNVESAPWGDDDDKELKSLVSQLGTRWVEIGQLMGRTQDFVHQRWRHKLNYGQGVTSGEWTTEELTKLEQEVETFATRKGTTIDDENLDIPWIAISKKIGNGRTAQQCSNRWRVSTTRRIRGKFVKVPHSDRIPGSATKAPRTPSKMEKRLAGKTKEKDQKQYKSADRVEDSDETDGEDDEKEGENIEEDVDGEEEVAGTEASDDEAEVQSDVDVTESSKDVESQSVEANGVEETETSRTPRSKRNGRIDSKDENSGQSKSTDDHEQTSADINMEDGSDSEEQASDASDIAPDTLKAHTPILTPASSRIRSSQQKPTTASSSEPPSSSARSQPQAQSQKTSSQPRLNSQKSSRTPAVSRNPLNMRKTPANGLSLTQLHAGTQADSTVKRTTERSNKSVVPDSVVPNRPSPELSMRKRPASSPLAMIGGNISGDEGSESEGDVGEDQNNNTKSPLSFVSAREHTQSTAGTDADTEAESGSGSVSRSANSDASTEADSNSNSGSEAEDSAADMGTPQPSRSQADNAGGFLESIKNYVPRWGSSQVQPSQKIGRKSLADVLRRDVDVEEESESDSDDDDD